MSAIAEISPHLDDEKKELLVKAAMMVAAAQSRASDKEQQTVKQIAQAVGMSETHLQGVVAPLLVAPPPLR